MARLASILRATLGAMALLGGHGAQAEWSGGVVVTSDNIQRGVSLSAHEPSAQAYALWRHTSGLAAGLGVATVSREQFPGSDGYQLKPELSWYGALKNELRWSLALKSQIFPGAHGPWFGTLPPAVQGRALKSQTSDYGTLELGASLGYGPLTLSAARSLTDYLGLAATETGPRSERVIESQGTTYLAADIDWPLSDRIALYAGIGRLAVPNFDRLSYSDWRLGATLQAWGLGWTLQITGSDADISLYRLPRRQTSVSQAKATESVMASVAWTF